MPAACPPHRRTASLPRRPAARRSRSPDRAHVRPPARPARHRSPHTSRCPAGRPTHFLQRLGIPPPHLPVPRLTSPRLAAPRRASPRRVVAGDKPTLAEALRDRNYYTALVGKWNLGSSPSGGPLAHGFDYHYGGLGDHLHYWTHTQANSANELREAAAAGETRGQQEHEQDEFLTELEADVAVEQLQAHAERADGKGIFLLVARATRPPPPPLSTVAAPTRRLPPPPIPPPPPTSYSHDNQCM